MKIIREECRRALSGRMMRLCLLLGILLVLGQCICYRQFLKEQHSFIEENADLYTDEFPESLYQSYMGGECFTLFWELYLSLFPILAVMPFAGSFYSDIEGGYIKHLCSRVPKGRVLLAKYIAVFLSGAIGVAFPIAISFFLSALLYPAQNPNPLSLRGGVTDIFVMSEYYYTQPLLYHGFYLAVFMLFGGVLACLSLLATYYIHNILLVLFVPYLFYTTQDLLLQRLQLAGWSLKSIINSQDSPIYPSLKTWQTMLVSFLVLFLVSLCGFLLIGWKRDTIAWRNSR